MDESIYNDMLRKGLISVRDWLTRAIEGKSPHLTVFLAHSEPIVFDALDRVLGTEDDWSEFMVWEN